LAVVVADGDVVGATVGADDLGAGWCLVAGGVVAAGEADFVDRRAAFGAAAPCPPTVVEQPTNAAAATRPSANDTQLRAPSIE
jgi:hypothetical protein